jgi:hypothetical protein
MPVIIYVDVPQPWLQDLVVQAVVMLIRRIASTQQGTELLGFVSPGITIPLSADAEQVLQLMYVPFFKHFLLLNLR